MQITVDSIFTGTLTAALMDHAADGMHILAKGTTLW
jgi:hypothetical protein